MSLCKMASLIGALAVSPVAKAQDAFVSMPQLSPAPRHAHASGALAAEVAMQPEVSVSSSSLPAIAAGLAAAAVMLRSAGRKSRRSARSHSVAPRTVTLRATEFEYGEDLSVPDDSFIVVGLAHCFEQVDGKLQDAFVLEPMTASTVEVIQNGCKTSYETYIGTTVGELLKEDASLFPPGLLNGHEAQWASNLKFRTGCAARTWMRDHARDVVTLLAPIGVLKSDFNKDITSKRILNFVNEVNDSDNVKQDMSIDVYGREEEEDGKDGEKDPAGAGIDDLYNA